MRRAAIFLLLGSFLLAHDPAAVLADLPGPDALGLYFDEEAQTIERDVATGASFEMFLILTHPTMNAIAGWEAAVILTNGNSVTTTDFPVGSQPLISGPEDWAVSMDSPMPCNVLTKLAVYTVLTVTEERAPIYLGNISTPSLEGDFPTVKVPGGDWSVLGLSSGDPELPVAAVNGSTPSDLNSWGSVKSLYR